MKLELVDFGKAHLLLPPTPSLVKTICPTTPQVGDCKGDFPRIKKQNENKTYNSEDSLVVTHPTTNSPACGLSTAERTGSPIFHTLWSYVSLYVRDEIMACGL